MTILLLWVAFRYNKKRNPEPATFTHHSTIEVLWTVIPIIILLFIGAFSVPILFKQQEIPVADVTIKGINGIGLMNTLSTNLDSTASYFREKNLRSSVIVLMNICWRQILR